MNKPGMVAHTFNFSTQEAEAGGISEFEVILIYTLSSSPSNVTS